ncbi:MAG TPA: hypothetical protein VIL85_03810 [Thermomicrobiales bacterium]
MARIATKQETDALIARYIEPYPGDARIEEYRLREEEHGYPVWSIIGSLTPDGKNAAQVIQDYDISPEALAAVRAFYACHKKALDNRLAANRAA